MIDIRTPRLVDLPRITDPRGDLTFAEEATHVPFRIAQVTWIYDLPAGIGHEPETVCGGDEFIVALSGSFTVSVHCSETEKVYELRSPFSAVLIPAGWTRRICEFSTNAVALVLSADGDTPNVVERP